MGEKIKPILIWKSENPRPLKGVDKQKLPVTYRSRKKASMSTYQSINQWLNTFNFKMRSQGRKVLCSWTMQRFTLTSIKTSWGNQYCVLFLRTLLLRLSPWTRILFGHSASNTATCSTLILCTASRMTWTPTPWMMLLLLKQLDGPSEPGLQSNLGPSLGVSLNVGLIREYRNLLSLLNHRWTLKK